MSQSSLFTIGPQQAAAMVREYQSKRDPALQCYLLQVSFRTLFSDGDVPHSCIKTLPRLLNGIPLGAGLMTRDQNMHIVWRYVEGSRRNHTFISTPIAQEEAEETRRLLKDRLLKQSRDIFGDLTVKATIVLSQCLHYDDEFIINDIAVPIEEGLHFRD